MKVVIGIAGQNGAGKGTFTRFCLEIIRNNGIEAGRHGSGGIVMDCLRLCALPETRHNAQRFVEMMEAGFAKGFLSGAMRKRILEDPSPCVFFDGVRLPSDVLMLRNLNGPDIISFLVYLSADSDQRFGRMRKRKEKAGEGELTREQFLEQEAAMTERFMAEIQTQADLLIGNNGTVQKLEEEAAQFCERFVLPLLKSSKN